MQAGMQAGIKKADTVYNGERNIRALNTSQSMPVPRLFNKQPLVDIKRRKLLSGLTTPMRGRLKRDEATIGPNQVSQQRQGMQPNMQPGPQPGPGQPQMFMSPVLQNVQLPSGSMKPDIPRLSQQNLPGSPEPEETRGQLRGSPEPNMNFPDPTLAPPGMPPLFHPHGIPHVPIMTPEPGLAHPNLSELMHQAQQRAAAIQQANQQPLTDQVRMSMMPADLDPQVKRQLLKVSEPQFRAILQSYMMNLRRSNGMQNDQMGGQATPAQMEALQNQRKEVKRRYMMPLPQEQQQQQQFDNLVASNMSVNTSQNTMNNKRRRPISIPLDELDYQSSKMTSNGIFNSVYSFCPLSLNRTISEDRTTDLPKRQKAQFIALEHRKSGAARYERRKHRIPPNQAAAYGQQSWPVTDNSGSRSPIASKSLNPFDPAGFRAAPFVEQQQMPYGFPMHQNVRPSAAFPSAPEQPMSPNTHSDWIAFNQEERDGRPEPKRMRLNT